MACLVAFVGTAGTLGCSTPPEDAIAAAQRALTAPAWEPGKAYNVGDLVSFSGKIYRVLQAHGSQVGWTPEAAPALFTFEAVDSGSNVPTTKTTPPAILTLDYVTVQANCNDSPESCCARDSTFSPLTANADVYYSTQANRCVSAEQGSDTIFLQSSGPSSLLLGAGDDTAMDGPGDDLIWGGYGRDTINGYGGTNLFFGGDGDDTIMAANGDNTVVPGPGRDTVSLGTGDDDLYLFDLCEVAAGETLDGGAGRDTLHAPVPLAQLRAMGVTVTHFESIVVEQNSCRSECSGRPACERGSCVEGDAPGEMRCECDLGWVGELCDAYVGTEHPQGVPRAILDAQPPESSAGVRNLSSSPPAGHGLLVDRGLPQGDPIALNASNVAVAGTGASGTTIGSGTSNANTGEFVVRITKHTEGDDGAGFGAETYLEARIDAVFFPRDDALDDCTEYDRCPVLRALVPSHQETISVHLKVKEADGGFEGNDDEELDVFLEVNNVTGAWTGRYISDAGDDAAFGPETSCATSSDDFGLCWEIEVGGRPRFCPTFTGAFIDSGLGEDVLPYPGIQEVPAAHAMAEVEVRQGALLQALWDGVLDENGCIPVGERPSASSFDSRTKTGVPLTVTTRLRTNFCRDPTDTECKPPVGGGNVGIQIEIRNQGATGPAEVCSIVTEDPSFVGPAECAVFRDTGPYFSPLDRAPFHASGNNDSTRAAGIIAAIFARDAELNGELGLDRAFLKRDKYLVKLNDPCFLDGIDRFTSHTTETEMCLQAPLPGAPSDVAMKFVIAHEFGHAVLIRSAGFLDNEYSFEGYSRWGCSHIDRDHNAHCLQGEEISAAAQDEGHAQYFAERVFNTGSNGCVLNYYKKVLAPACLPTLPGGVCDDRSDGLKITSPPMAIRCDEPIRHRNQNPGFPNRVGLDETVATHGTEWDWMTFYHDLTMTAGTMTHNDLLDVYQSACLGASLCDISYDGTPTTAGGLPARSFLKGIEGVFGAFSPELDRAKSAARRNGVGLELTR